MQAFTKLKSRKYEIYSKYIYSIRPGTANDEGKLSNKR